MRRSLVVNADDFGRSRGVSAGIVEAHLDGLVSTTTALVNLPGALDDVAQAARRAPALGLGVHLNLTLGRPVADSQSVASLVTPQGTFLSPDALVAQVERIDTEDVAREWRAQIEVFLSTGASLDHLDSHHHVALLSPAWWAICLDLAARFRCGVRPPAPADPRDDVLVSRFPEAARRFAAGDAGRLRASRGVPSPDRLVTRFFGAQATLGTLLAVLAEVPAGTTELMCHAGRVDAVLLAESGYAQERESELLALISVPAREAANRLAIERGTYRQLVNASA
jgi:predicted glycoside hydrolase/deacetylase ChbG (UPF0249 family)